MHIGIGPEKGNRVADRNEFSYACERCLYGDVGEREEFMKLAKESESIEEFAKALSGWYYSGNWIYDGFDNKETCYIIRFSDKTLRSFFGTYVAAIESARGEAKERGLGFVVN